MNSKKGPADKYFLIKQITFLHKNLLTSYNITTEISTFCGLASLFANLG